MQHEDVAVLGRADGEDGSQLFCTSEAGMPSPLATSSSEAPTKPTSMALDKRSEETMTFLPGLA